MIAILTPYDRGETTSAAIRLADLLVGFGRKVKLVACGRHEKRVSPIWDGRVQDGNDGRVMRIASKAAAVVHFQAHEAWLKQATVADVAGKPKPKQILVPDWYNVFVSAFVIEKFDQIVCPTRLCRDLVRQEVFDGDKVDKTRLSYCRWDSGLPPVRREGTVEGGKLWACLACDGSAVDFNAPMIIQLADELLTLFPKLSLSVLAFKSWARRDQHDLKRLSAKWDKRFRVRRLAGMTDLVQEYHAHDWAVLPGVRAEFGFYASTALACGTPVVCHDVEPYCEIVDKESGLLVKCDVRTGTSKTPIAVPSFAHWVETCTRAFKDTRVLFQTQRADWKLVEARAAFAGTWKAVLEDHC